MAAYEKFMFLGALLLASCGNPAVDKGPASGVSVSPSWWSNVNRNHTYIAVDKYFSGDSNDSFFNCLVQNGVDAYIATYNSGLVGGENVDTHLQRAKKAGLKLSAYFAFNDERDLRDSAIDDFLRRIRPYSIKTVWLDIEMPARNIDALTQNWHQRVCKDAGYQCGVYTNYGGMNAASYPTNYKAPLDDMYLWFAIWDEVANHKYNVGNFYAWSESHAKQFANGRLCNTEVDMNAFAANLFDGKGSVNPPTVVPPKTSGGNGGGCWIGNLSGSGFVKVRAKPTRQASSLRDIWDGESVVVRRMVQGEEIYDSDLGRSDSRWAEIEGGGYINGLYVICN